jgi:small subunit ribosomal protein S17
VSKAPPEVEKRGQRRVITGMVTSAKMQKTVAVTVIRRFRDRRFHKFINRRVKYHAHDEKEVANEGDTVELLESRPMSKTKRWTVFRVVKKAEEVVL